MNLVRTNCSNNYGPRQFSEKLTPTIIRKALGDEKNICNLLFFDDHCGRSGETYNIGWNAEKTYLQVVNSILSILDKKLPLKSESYNSLITFSKDRPGHDRRYAIDATKLKNELGATGLFKCLDCILL